ncbi:MAG: hypothetical protein A4E24_01138 [Methanomethylovorans sp. PtaU1.Bin093]|uniref:hypothetical protein n=1 Tax=Methanomethylovorans sp. PtaU1.Bin093 TaxID=1811679 RepID=UPI0009C97311|nr:hypothetical protein [Methanomethylovorans sp. PtaU1.Bin093]OPY20458.1 MAG: hypothetical protein A4E24_01138 [Methanomethylovorans sp. PtaU1.Bin093]
MRLLKRCPNCHTRFKTCENDMQVCKVCGYWTKRGTARLEPLVLYDSVVLEE